MSLTITLYKGCKLTNKYHEVFRSKTSLDTYLSGLTYLQVYNGDDVYYTNSGTISIDNTYLTSHNADSYNYMVFNESGIKRYCFVNSIQLVNSVAIVTYEEDIWHNYGITSSTFNFKMKDSLISQTIKMTAYGTYSQSFFDNLPKKLPIELEGQNRPKFRVRTPIPDNDENVYVLLTASVYKLGGQGEVNFRVINNYLLTHQCQTTDSVVPVITREQYTWSIDNQLTQIISDIYAMSSDTSISYQTLPNFRYEILNIKLIPESIGDDWFTSILSADETHDDGLYSDFSLTGYEYAFPVGTANPKLPKYQFNTTWRFRNINLREENQYAYNNGDETIEGYYFFNGFSDTEVIKSEKTILDDYKYIGIGNASRFIKLNYDGHTKKLEYHLVINQFGNAIQLYFGNEVVDISSDFELHCPISVQSADVTQQQKIALSSSNLTQAIGLVAGTMNLGASIGSLIGTHGGSSGGDYAGTFSKLVNDTSKLVTQGIQLDAMNQAQFVTNHATNSYDVTLFNCYLGGLREIEMEYNNSTLLTSMLALYGYIYSYITDSIECVYTQDNFVKFTTANIYGEFSQEIARGIESILENGLRFL